MSGGARLVAATGALCAAMAGSAFLLKHLPCGQNLEAYAVLGIVVFMALIALPWILHRGASVLMRSGCSAAALAAGVAAWAAGFHFSGIPLLCRLF